MTAPGASQHSAVTWTSEQCFLCQHPRRQEFEAMLAGGCTQAEVARLAGCGPIAVWRHLANHTGIGAEQRAARLLGRRLHPAAVEPVQRLLEVRALLWEGAQEARARGTEGYMKLVPRFGRELARIEELIVRWGGGPTPEAEEAAAEARGGLKALAAVVLAALHEHPDARIRVAEALASLGNGEPTA